MGYATPRDVSVYYITMIRMVLMLGWKLLIEINSFEVINYTYGIFYFPGKDLTA